MRSSPRYGARLLPQALLSSSPTRMDLPWAARWSPGGKSTLGMSMGSVSRTSIGRRCRRLPERSTSAISCSATTRPKSRRNRVSQSRATCSAMDATSDSAGCLKTCPGSRDTWTPTPISSPRAALTKRRANDSRPSWSGGGADGTPLALSPDRPDPTRVNQDFSFAGDTDGRRCPFSAHIRVVNPRDQPLSPRVTGGVPHLLRRGSSYGPEWVPGRNDAADRGLLGLFLCTASRGNSFRPCAG